MRIGTMSDEKLYQALGAAVVARANCEKSGNAEWFEKWTDKIKAYLGLLPHGSGLDGQWDIDYARSREDHIVLTMSYHAMDENGFYDGWIDFSLTITPSLQLGFKLNIRGNFGKYGDVKDYLYETLDAALR